MTHGSYLFKSADYINIIVPKYYKLSGGGYLYSTINSAAIPSKWLTTNTVVRCSTRKRLY